MIKQFFRYIKQLIHYLLQRYKGLRKRYQVLIPLCLIFLLFFIFCLPSPLFNLPYSTVVFDRNGELLGARIAKDQQWRFPASDSIPDKYKTCVIGFEDQYFEYHWGTNPLSMLRALKQNVSEKRTISGASTITMQTIRLSRRESRTIFEKAIEAILATRLEFSYSKDEILRLYASHAPMGGNVVGIDAASWRYFGHDSNKLSWAEAATLAILPNSPSLMHFGKNRDKVITKRNNLLKRLREKGEMDEIDYNLALSEPLPPHPYPLPQIAPHLVTKLYVEQEGKHLISTVEKYTQERVEGILNRWNAEFSQNAIKNIAALVIDVNNNEVLAYCGNVHFEKTSSANQVDIIQAPRSTGSVLKPFLYAAMLQDGELLPDELLPDVPVNINGYSPKNFSLLYDGAVPASQALARSLNIPSVISLRKYSIPKFYNLLKKGGITTLNYSPEHYGLSLVLGGCEGKLWDISNLYLQMAHSIASYNQNGNYYEYLAPDYILRNKKKKKEETTTPLFQAGVSWLTLEALTNVNRPEEIDWRSIPSMQKIAWKTGTSFGGRDGWSIGITPRYLVAVWVGNSDGEGRPGLTGARTSGHVMFDIFNSLPKSNWFKEPLKDLIPAEICQESGLLKGLYCPETSVITTNINKKGLNGNSCTYHKLVHLSEDMRYQVYNDCAGRRGIIHRAWFILPPRWEWYYKERNTKYTVLPSYSPECTKNDNTRIMDFIYPYHNTTVSLPKQLDGLEGEVVFELAHSFTGRTIYWHLDNNYIGETTHFHKKSHRPTKGKHRLTVVDETGISMSIDFVVR